MHTHRRDNACVYASFINSILSFEFCVDLTFYEYIRKTMSYVFFHNFFNCDLIIINFYFNN